MLILNKGDFFGNDKPIVLELGCGKGDFIVGTAAKEPDVNFLAVEKVSDVVSVGDRINVMLIEIDRMGRYNFSRKDTMISTEE